MFGCPILRVVCEGWDATNVEPAAACPILCKKRKGWSTQLLWFGLHHCLRFDGPTGDLEQQPIL